MRLQSGFHHANMTSRSKFFARRPVFIESSYFEQQMLREVWRKGGLQTTRFVMLSGRGLRDQEVREVSNVCVTCMQGMATSGFVFFSRLCI